ncbi:molybdopterin-synthase adenylyltransferase MoeB [bacterium]|nr:molybdopterin-synthase adenylyltransferase MoeB [bacterium]
MSITVRLPTPLRPMAEGKDAVAVEGKTLAEILDDLETRHAGLKARICDGDGKLRRFVNVYVNDEDVRGASGLDTPVKDGDVVSVIPAIAGGAKRENESAPVVTFRDLLSSVKSGQTEISPDEVRLMLERGDDFVLLDVRELDEVRAGHLPRARHIPRGLLELQIEAQVPDRDTPIVTYCAGGARSALAAESLSRMGYRNLRVLTGGWTGWSGRGFAAEKPVFLSDGDRARYARHLTIPEVGEAGQVKLLSSKVLMVGAGGLGCPAAIYLAAAGVGTMGLVDFDVVDESNLQRQILHTTDRIGTPKIASAQKTLLDFNPKLKLVPFEERLTSENVERLFEDFDIIVDGTDNFPTRYLINDACVKLGKPNVHGSVYRFEGQVTVFHPAAGGPCYRCLYPAPPPPELAPSCADAGVLGVLPGVIGLLEAVEAVKLILGIGDPLIGRLLAYDGLESKFREFRLRKDPDCEYCAEGKPFPGYVDYEHFCSSAATA